MGRLLLLFIAVPAIELVLLIEIGRHIGTLATLGLIVFTGALGAALARHQGLSVLHQVQSETAAGRIPAGALLDGVLILIAGAVLMTPGVLTDLFGFLCLVPAFRTMLKRYLRRRFESAAQSGRVHVTVSPQGPMRDVTPREPSDDAGDRPRLDG